MQITIGIAVEDPDRIKLKIAKFQEFDKTLLDSKFDDITTDR